MFRTEVLSRRSERLYGEPLAVLAPSWSAITILLVGVAFGGCAFLMLASYTKYEEASGVLSSSAGVSNVDAVRPGVLTRLYVREGQTVVPGQPLATIRTEEYSGSGESPGEATATLLQQRELDLASEQHSIIAAANAEVARLSRQRSGLTTQIEKVADQIALQRKLTDSARTDFMKIKSLKDQGFVSIQDINLRESNYFSREQQLADLESTLASKKQELDQTKNLIDEAILQANDRAKAVSASRRDVANQLVADAAGRAYTLKSSVSGHVSGLTASIGSAISGGDTLMSVVPPVRNLRAQISLAPAAVGLVQEGQPALLAFDAYPASEFGSIRGHVQSVSRSMVPSADPSSPHPTFIALIALSRDYVIADGHKRQVLPGMSFQAKIRVAKSPLWRWLINSVQR